MQRKWHLLKFYLILALCIIMTTGTTSHAEELTRTPYFYYWYGGIINDNNETFQSITVHEGETLSLTYAYIDPDEGIIRPEELSNYYSIHHTWTITVGTTLDENALIYNNEHAIVWSPSVDTPHKVCIKGLKATDAGDNYYLTLFRYSENKGYRVFASIPITVIPAEAGANYTDFGATKPSDLYLTTDELLSAMRKVFLNKQNGEYVFYTSHAVADSVRDDYASTLYNQYVFDPYNIFDFYSSQGSIPATEGDYLEQSFLGSRATSTNYEDNNYRGEILSAITLDTSGTLYITTPEQEAAFEAKLSSLFASGGPLAYAKTASPHDKVTACMNYIHNNVSYIGTVEEIYHTAYSALCNGKATCQGYALLFYRMLRELGIENRILMGLDAGAHTYNIVLLNGKYYYCDASNNIAFRGSNTFAAAELQERYTTEKFQSGVLSKISATDYDPSAVSLVTDITLNAESAILTAQGQTLQLAATVTPADADNAEITWSSSDTSVITVDSNGFVTAVGNGMAGVIVKTTDNTKAAVCVITVSLPTSGEAPSVQEQNVRNFVERMYTIVLNRSAEEGGLNFWTAELIALRSDGASVASDFINGTEFIGRNLSDSDYIDTLYRAILNREADDSGRSYWLELFAQGYTRQALLNGFISSQEFNALCNSYGILAIKNQEGLVRKFIERMYTVALSRSADESGLDYWSTALLNGSLVGTDVGNHFINSGEFEARNTTDSKYIQILYSSFFNREADTGGMAAWLKAMALGTPRKDILNGFIYSNEFNNLCAEYGIIAVR